MMNGMRRRVGITGMGLGAYWGSDLVRWSLGRAGWHVVWPVGPNTDGGTTRYTVTPRGKAAPALRRG